MHPVILTSIGMPAGMEWLVILIVGLLLFGNRLPTMMRGLGGSIKEFKRGMDEGPASSSSAASSETSKHPPQQHDS